MPDQHCKPFEISPETKVKAGRCAVCMHAQNHECEHVQQVLVVNHAATAHAQGLAFLSRCAKQKREDELEESGGRGGGGGGGEEGE